MEPLLILAAACISGFCSSAPLGAINLWVTDRVLERRQLGLAWFLFGVIAMDCVHASLAAWGYHAFVDEGPVARWLSVAGGAFLIVLGSLSLLKRARAATSTPATTVRRPLSNFLLGVFMCGANPAFLVFWVFAINQVEHHLQTIILDWRLGIFLLGVAAGDAAWFRVLLHLVRKGRDSVRPRVLASVRMTIAEAFVLVGTAAVYHGFKLQ